MLFVVCLLFDLIVAYCFRVLLLCLLFVVCCVVCVVCCLLMMMMFGFRCLLVVFCLFLFDVKC